MKKLIVSLFAIALVSAAFAGPTGTTIVGQTGSFEVPNAYVAEDAMITVTQILSSGSKYPVVTAVIPWGDIVETSACYAIDASEAGRDYYGDSKNLLTLGAKVAVPINFFSTDLGVGVGYARWDGWNQLSGYASVSKDICGVTATMNYKFITDDYGDGTSLAFNLEKSFADSVSVGVDYVTQSTGPNAYGVAEDYFFAHDSNRGWEWSNKSRFNAYCRFDVADSFQIQAAMSNIGQAAKWSIRGGYKF